MKTTLYSIERIGDVFRQVLGQGINMGKVLENERSMMVD